MANSALQQLFGPCRDHATRTYFSNLLGQKTVTKKNETFGTSHSKDGRASSSSVSYTTEKQPLLSPEQIGNLDGILTIVDGKKVVIDNTPYFKSKYDGVDINAVWLDDEERDLLRKGIKPKDETHELFLQKADQPMRF